MMYCKSTLIIDLSFKADFAPYLLWALMKKGYQIYLVVYVFVHSHRNTLESQQVMLNEMYLNYIIQQTIVMGLSEISTKKAAQVGGGCSLTVIF